MTPDAETCLLFMQMYTFKEEKHARIKVIKMDNIENGGERLLVLLATY